MQCFQFLPKCPAYCRHSIRIYWMNKSHKGSREGEGGRETKEKEEGRNHDCFVSMTDEFVLGWSKSSFPFSGNRTTLNKIVLPAQYVAEEEPGEVVASLFASLQCLLFQEEFSALPRCSQHWSHSYLSIIAQLTLPVLEFPVISQCFTSRFTCAQGLWKVKREVKFTFPIGFLSQHGYIWNIVSFAMKSVPSAFLPVSDAIRWPVINGACW